METIIRIDIAVKTQDESDILIAQLSDFGFYAFEETPHVLSCFSKSSDYNDPVLQSYLFSLPIEFKLIKIEQQNWNAHWESSFQPVVVENYVMVRADFHQKGTEHLIDLIITPKMSFGTAHHPTTYLMIQAMQDISFAGHRVLDFGTGTGILAILAFKLGAVDIWALDVDVWSINNSIENCKVNESHNISVLMSDSIPTGEQFQIIMANISLNTILEKSFEIKTASCINGLLLVSGFLTRDSWMIEKTFSNLGFSLSRQFNKEGWACLEFHNTTEV